MTVDARAPIAGWTPPDANARRRLLLRHRRVALVGVSAKRERPSHFVATYLQAQGRDFDVSFVNPRAKTILSRPVCATLADLPAPPEIVVAFRKPADLPDVAIEAVSAGAAVLWLQLGLWSPEAAAIALDAGLDLVMDRCLKIEHARFFGGLHLAGFDTGVIRSRRRRS